MHRKLDKMAEVTNTEHIYPGLIPTDRDGRVIYPQEKSIPKTPMEMVQEALYRGASMDIVERLLAMHDRFEEKRSKQAFENALSMAKSKIPIIKKNKKVGYTSKDPSKGSTNYSHEDLAEIMETINPILSEHGLNIRFWPTQNGSQITAHCALSHADGHMVESSLTANADTSGAKNSIQAIGSTCTYLTRYLLKMTLGLAASDDDDGVKHSDVDQSNDADVPITQEQLNQLIEISDQLSIDKIKFCKFAKIDSLADLQSSRFEWARQNMNRKKNAS